MATVVTLQPVVREPLRTPESPAQRRVRIGSGWIARLFTGLFWLAVATLIAAIGAMIFYRGELLRVAPQNFYLGEGPANSVAFSSLPLVHRLVYVAVALVRTTPVLMIFWNLRALFRHYAHGQVFSRAAALRFVGIGGWLCAYAVSPLLCHLALSITGYELDKNWAHLASLQAFVLGLLVLVIGQVMQVGREIEEDREAFV